MATPLWRAFIHIRLKGICADYLFPESWFLHEMAGKDLHRIPLESVGAALHARCSETQPEDRQVCPLYSTSVVLLSNIIKYVSRVVDSGLNVKRLFQIALLR